MLLLQLVNNIAFKKHFPNWNNMRWWQSLLALIDESLLALIDDSHDLHWLTTVIACIDWWQPLLVLTDDSRCLHWLMTVVASIDWWVIACIDWWQSLFALSDDSHCLQWLTTVVACIDWWQSLLALTDDSRCDSRCLYWLMTVVACIDWWHWMHFSLISVVNFGCVITHYSLLNVTTKLCSRSYLLKCNIHIDNLNIDFSFFFFSLCLKTSTI
jgi:hypothetical protein